MEGLTVLALVIVVVTAFGVLAAVFGVDSRYDWADDRAPGSTLSG